MDKLEEQIRKAYSAPTAATSPCLTVEQLEDFYADRLQAERMEEMRSHLTSCPSCVELARDYCAFADIQPLQEGWLPSPMALRKIWISWRAYSSRPMLQLAAAVLVVVGIGLLWTLSRRPVEPNVTRSAQVSARLELVSPKGTLQDIPRTLVWQPAASADHYEVEMRDTGLNVVWKESAVKSTEISISDSALRRLQPGADYAWRVTAVTRDGRRLASPFATFRILGKQ